jgi:hypothetical protein
MWSFGLDFTVLVKGSVLRDLGVNSLIIVGETSPDILSTLLHLRNLLLFN